MFEGQELPAEIFAKASDPTLDETAEKIKAEIVAHLCKKNPNVGRTQSVTLKKGPLTFKTAVIYQILDAISREHHHIVLSIQSWSYKKKTGLIEEKEKHNITLDNENQDEIGILNKSINAFLDEITADPDVYAVLKKRDFELLSDKNKVSIKDSLNEILEDEKTFNALINQGGISLLKGIIDWAIQSEEPNKVVNKLQELEIVTLNDLNVITGLAQLQKAIDVWKVNKDEDNEEYWQKCINDFPWIVSQIFSYPFVIFSQKAYLGGKNINNKGGNIVDFLFKNKVTNNVALIEIKTPSTRIIGNKYRQTYSMSTELSGAINQLLNYKKQLQYEYYQLNRYEADESKFLALSPKTILIIGNYEKELQDKDACEAFELYRSNSREIEILTFDELFQKVESLVELFKSQVH